MRFAAAAVGTDDVEFHALAVLERCSRQAELPDTVAGGGERDGCCDPRS